MKNIWLSLKRPFLVQAPMENVTDSVFRQIIGKAGKPDLFFTEFTNTDGLLSKGYDKVSKRLQFTEIERPIIAQIWGNKPESYFEVAKLITTLGFDGIDINMGCPDHAIVARGSCGGLIQNPTLAKEIIQATKEGAKSASRRIPVSVKTRIGYSKIQTEEWIGFLLTQDIAALIVHGRTVKEMSKVPAHWDEIGKVVSLRNEMNCKTIIIGNGDVETYQEAMEKAKEYGLDGIMIGRGIFHNLWIFNPSLSPEKISPEEKLKMLIEHLTLFDNTWGKNRNFDIMKKFYKIYLSGSHEANELRLKLMEFGNAKDTLEYLKTSSYSLSK